MAILKKCPYPQHEGWLDHPCASLIPVANLNKWPFSNGLTVRRSKPSERGVSILRPSDSLNDARYYRYTHRHTSVRTCFNTSINTLKHSTRKLKQSVCHSCVLLHLSSVNHYIYIYMRIQ